MSPVKFGPPPSLPPRPPSRREKIMRGHRECDFTIATFDLHSFGGEHDTLTIEIDDRRVTSPTKLAIRGKWEAAEMPAHLRWLADAIAQHGENKNPAIHEHVNYEKLRGGGA